MHPQTEKNRSYQPSVDLEVPSNRTSEGANRPQATDGPKNPSRRGFLGLLAGSLVALTPTGTGRAEAVPEEKADRPRIRAKADEPARLRTAHSWWSLEGLPRGGPEWSMEEKFRRVKEAGFEGIEIWIEPKDEDRVRRLLDENGLFLGTGFHPNTVDDFKKAISQAKRMRAEYIYVHPGNAFLSDEEAAHLVGEGYKIAHDAGVPMTLETHRGTVTENPYRAMRLAGRIPELRLTGDLSHYGVGAEIGGEPAKEIIRLLSPLLDRVDTLQARITNGEQVQLDVGDGSGELAQNWVELWAEVMRRWRKRAQPGEWFPFSTELGPPSYSIVDFQGKEMSDRWEQSLVMKRLMAQAWEKSRAG